MGKNLKGREIGKGICQRKNGFILCPLCRPMRQAYREKFLYTCCGSQLAGRYAEAADGDSAATPANIHDS